MYQKHEISIPVGYKTVRLKKENGNDCVVISGLSQETDFRDFANIFLFSYKQNTFVRFLGKFLSSQ